jgi:hypothetical protein
MTLGQVPGDIASWHQLYLVAKPFHVGVNMDGLACPLHYPTFCSYQTREQGFQLGDVLSHQVAVGGGPFPGDPKPPGLDIRWSVDRLGTCINELYMEYIVFTKTRFTLCQNHYGAYVRIPRRTTISDGDEMDPST